MSLPDEQGSTMDEATTSTAEALLREYEAWHDARVQVIRDEDHGEADPDDWAASDDEAVELLDRAVQALRVTLEGGEATDAWTDGFSAWVYGTPAWDLSLTDGNEAQVREYLDGVFAGVAHTITREVTDASGIPGVLDDLSRVLNHRLDHEEQVCEHCGDEVTADTLADAWVHSDSGDDRCRGRDDYSASVNGSTHPGGES
jgi:hypothetical protein